MGFEAGRNGGYKNRVVDNVGFGKGFNGPQSKLNKIPPWGYK